MPLTYCDVFSFLWRSIQSMTCFFDCFRIRNDHRRHRPQLLNSSPSAARDDVDGKIRISSLFATEEEEDCVVKERENLVRRVSRPEIDAGLLEEVKLLKACGTLPETPAEIRKAVKFSERVEIADMRNPLALRALQSSPDTPASIRKEEFLAETSRSENSDSGVESSPETPEEMQKIEFTFGISEKSDVQEPRSMLKASPYPTPRRITDDMQTPGTVYATNMKNLTVGNARIRCQYVYTVLNPIDSLHQLHDFSEEHSATHLTSNHEKESLLQPGDTTPLPPKGSNEESVNEDTLGDVSLSSWLKPPLANGGNDRHNQEAASMREPNIRDTPHIIDLVAAHWNEQEDTPHIQPKWRGGNGIPNSTTKYKEDQKVRWRATPFEERLEKALTEETCVSQRKPVTGSPIIFEESEGQDTATPQVQTAPKSVVSL
ncbi:hypothetical protein RND81_11G084600 [Saponaria officinalis]|uniref:Protein JASON n=1 Tax=Saponaria officinalis TaxID=3572 RepID=A0AAW1HJN6_SAPOF